MRTLTAKQSRFIEEMIVDLNATQAAIRAGYSPRTADRHGSRLLANPKVRQALTEAQERRSERVQVNADQVLAELKRIAFLDIGAAFQFDGSLKPLHEIPEDVRRGIAGIDVDELMEGVGRERRQVGVTRKVRFCDKLRALEMIGRHLKLFTDQVELSFHYRLADRLEAAQARASAVASS